MRAVVLGSGGRTGRALVDQALAGGHEVVAVARAGTRPGRGDGERRRQEAEHRRPEAERRREAERLETVAGDVRDPDFVDGVVAGADAVIFAAGPADRAPSLVCSEGVWNVLRAMQTHGVKRLVCMASSLRDPRRPGLGPVQRLWTTAITERVFRNTFVDMDRMEDELRRSDAAWTLVQAVRLTDGPSAGRYRVAVGNHLQRPRGISRTDLASYVLDHLGDASTYQTVVEISY